MSPELENYEAVSVYNLDEEDKQKLLRSHAECSFNWSTRDGWPMGVIMSYLWQDGRVWLTAGAHRHRISAVRRDPRVSVVITSTGTKLGPGRSITIKGRCVIHEDQETKDWFYPACAAVNIPTAGKLQDAFAQMMDTERRLVIEVVPEKWITLDSDKMGKDTRGELTDEERGPPLEADAKRMPEELKRRGLD